MNSEGLELAPVAPVPIPAPAPPRTTRAARLHRYRQAWQADRQSEQGGR